MDVSNNASGIELSDVTNNRGSLSTVLESMAEEKHTHNTKRNELQGLRTVAITAVLMFHIWPDMFRNGFLGVDMWVYIA